jgi:hypothetical protein
VNRIAVTACIDNTPDWTSGAHSVATFVEDGAYEFKVKSSSVGVVVGITNADISTDPNEAPISAFFSKRQVMAGDYVGVFGSDDIFTMARLHGVIVIIQNGFPLMSAVSPVTGTFMLDASLLARDDTIIGATTVDVSSFNSTDGLYRKIPSLKDDFYLRFEGPFSN